MNSPKQAKARDEDLVVQELPDEILVFNVKTNEAHCLNKTAAFVWKNCDGKNTVTDIAKLLEAGFGNPVKEDFVWLAIDLLDKKDLLTEKINFRLPNRREAIKKIGLASMTALPIIASLTAPPSAWAGTANCACINPGNCFTQTGCPNLNNCNGSGVCAP